MTASKRALIYTRVSRDDTGEGKSNDRQKEACLALAQARGWTVVPTEYDDISVSAYSGRERPAWNRVLEAMKSREVDYVIAWQLDRITRTVRELTALVQLARETDVAIVTASGDLDLSNAPGKFLATVLSAVAEMEVEHKGARQKLANQQRAAEGRAWVSGWRAFGFEKDMRQIPAEVELIRKAAVDVLNGASLKSIARRWRDSGVTTPRSAKGANGWTHNGVKSILLNPRNAGLNTYRGQVVGPGNWSPIFDESLHHQLVALLTDPKRLLRRTGSNGRTPTNLLSGIARCGTCGETVNAGSSNGKRVYKCTGTGEHITTDREAANAFVINALLMVASTTRPGLVLDLATPGDVEGVANQLTALDSRQGDVAAAYAEGSIPLDAWQRANEAMNAERAVLETQLAEVDVTLGRTADSRHSQSISNFASLDLNGRRDLLRTRAEITLHSRDRRRNVPMPKQVSVFMKISEGPAESWLPIATEHADAWTAMKAGTSLWPTSAA